MSVNKYKITKLNEPGITPKNITVVNKNIIVLVKRFLQYIGIKIVGTV